ncbi:hypothetical protein Tco_0228450 [Tanacetum coccineum]
MSRGAPNLAKRDLRNLQTTGVVVGSAFGFKLHFDRIVDSTHQVCMLLAFRKDGKGPHEVRMPPNVKVRTAPIAKSLASHMSSKGKSQSGAIKIGASVNFLLSVLKDSIHSFEKKMESIFQANDHGAAILEKSCMNRR